MGWLFRPSLIRCIKSLHYPARRMLPPGLTAYGAHWILTSLVGGPPLPTLANVLSEGVANSTLSSSTERPTDQLRHERQTITASVYIHIRTRIRGSAYTIGQLPFRQTSLLAAWDQTCNVSYSRLTQ